VLVRASAAQKCGLNVRIDCSPLYTVGDVSRPSPVTLGEANVNVEIDIVLADDHCVKIVSDFSIPVDALVGITWLKLPHIGYYKCGQDLVLETTSSIDTNVLSGDDGISTKDAYIATTKSSDAVRDPIVIDDVHVDDEVPVKQREELLELLNNYRDVFAKNLK